MKHIAIVGAGLVCLLIGCGQPKAMLAGGKPVSHWLKALQDPDPKVRKTAVAKLGSVGTADTAALPAVLGALKDPHAAVRREAILAVLKCGPAASEAIPTLAEMQRNDRNPQVRSYAAQALGKLNGGK
jgi:vesicle coat complex subunit